MKMSMLTICCRSCREVCGGEGSKSRTTVATPFPYNCHQEVSLTLSHQGAAAFLGMVNFNRKRFLPRIVSTL
jgi:hypothetical protein